MTESTTTNTGLDKLVLSELPIDPSPTVEEFVKIEGKTLIINPSGIPCEPITDARTAKAYAYVISRLVSGWYLSLAPRKHIFHQPTMPLTLNRGVYKDATTGKWFFLDSINGQYVKTSREVRPASRVEAHEFNDQVCQYRLEISLANKDGDWQNWASVMIECLNAPDRTEANRILNEAIKDAAERREEWKATGKAVRDGNATEVKSVVIKGTDLMEFSGGTVWDKTVDARIKWSCKDAYAVMRVAAAKAKGHDLVFERPEAVI